MMYSILDSNYIFEDWEDFEPEYDTLELNNGITLQVKHLNNQEARIVQVISSNPLDYLNTTLSPGKIIKYKLHLD